MANNIIGVAAILLAGAAAPALAADEARLDGKMTYDAPRDRYCLVSRDALTGTRIPTRTCKTQEDWRREGLTVGRR